MKRKGFCFKRAVSLLLAAVMIVTAAPQTSLTALAAEQGMSMDTSGVSEDLEILTTEDGTSMKTGDTAPSESEDTAGQGDTEADGDIGDENADVPSNDDVGVGSDEQPADPDNADRPDNVGDNTENPDGINQDDAAGDSDETTNPEESMDDDLTVDGESVSGNDLADGVSVFGDGSDEGPSYKGDVFEGSDNEGNYSALRIDENAAKANEDPENGNGIMAILEYYAEQGQKFNFIEFNLNVNEDLPKTLKSEYINGAVAILGDEDASRNRYWINYNFCQEEGDTTVNTSYSLWRPRECNSDINVNLTIENKPCQGVLFNISATEFPSEGASFNYRTESITKGNLSACLGETKDVELGMLTWDESSGIPTGRAEPYGIYFHEEGQENENGTIYVSEVGADIFDGMEAGQAYLITPLYADKDSVAKGTTKNLTAGERSGSSDNLSNVKWGVFDEELISIEPAEDNTATLTAKEMGEAYYYVTYQSGTDNYLELHAVRLVVATEDGKELNYVGESREETIEDGENAGAPYRRLVINEGEAKEQNNDAEIADILTYYAKQIEAGKCEKFNCVEFNIDAISSSEILSFPMKKDDINGAISIMDTTNEQIGYWIDYNSWNEADRAGVHYSLSQPHEVEEDLNASFTVTLVPHQGVKVNAATTELPAESVNVSYNIEEKEAFSACWDGAKQEDLRLMALDDGVSPSVTEPDGMWFEEYQFENENGPGYGSNFGLNIKGIQAGHDYLITPLYADKDSVSMGMTKELTAGERSGSSDGAGVSDVVWKSLDENMISIESGTGATATLTAKNEMGEAYYRVTYTRDGKEWLELRSVQVTYKTAGGGELAYIGEVRQDEFEDGDLAGTSYRRLVIDEEDAKEQNNGAEITDILAYYAKQIEEEKCEKFNCVEFNIIDESPDTRVVKKDYINGALSIMDMKNDRIGYWMDYNFRNDQTEVNFVLGSPYEARTDVNATFSLTDLENQGLKVKFASTAFPAERVSMSYNQPDVKYTDSLPLNENPFRLFTHSSGTPKTMVDTNEEQGWGYYATGGEGDDTWTSIHFNNIKPLGTTEYLAASIYEDEERPEVGGEPIQLKAGKRAVEPASNTTSVTWKLFDTDKATIDKDGKLTAWSDRDAIYYYVQYKVGSAQYLEVHEMHAQSQAVEIYFDKTDVEMEMNVDSDPNAEPFRQFLRLRFKPSDAERDTHDPDQIRWEITENGSADKPVIDFVYYDNDWKAVKRDENGNPPAGAAPNGEIIALNEGTAKVKVSYLDVEEGAPIPTAECTVKVVRPIIWGDMEQEINAMNLYAVTDLDTKLSAVKLGKGWEWKDPNTSLANFKGMDGCQFPAVYTDEASRKTFNTSLWVRFVTVTGIEIESKNENKQEGSDEPDWFDWVPDSIEQGNKITLRYSYRMDCLDGESDETWQAEYDAVKARIEKEYQIEWTSSPINAGTAANDGTYQFTAPSITKAQKYTFTVSVKDKTTNKVFLKNSCAITVTVNSVFDWNSIEELKMDNGPDPDDPYHRWFLRFNIKGMTKNEYMANPLTIVSEDTTILKLDNRKETVGLDEKTDDEGNKYISLVVPTLPNTEPKPGTAWIKMTASDEMKSSRRFCAEIIDKEPKLMESAITINQALEDKSAEVTVRTHTQYPIDTGKVTLLLNGNATNDITANVTDSTLIGNAEDKENSYFDYNIKLNLKENAASVKKGKNTVTLNLVVNPEDSAGANTGQETYSLNLTVNVINTVPKVTFKQAKKVNLFYKDEEGYGILNVNVTGTDIKELILEECDFVAQQKMEDQGSEPGSEPGSESESISKLVPVPGVYDIIPKANANGSNKKGKLSYKLDGCSGTYTTNFTVSVENKKPTIVLSQKSDTLYPIAGYMNSWLWMTDKATGENIIPSEVTYVDKNKEKHSLTLSKEGDVDWANHEDECEWNISDKTDYNMIAFDWGPIVFMLQEPEDDEGYNKKTDKFSLDIKKANWATAVTISYSIKVDTAKPKLVLGKSTLTLNKNDAVYRAQQERTSLHLKGTSDAVYQNEWHWVTFDGQDEKSRKILRTDNNLVLQYRNDQGDVVVNFNDNKETAVGTYKFKVSVGNNGVGLIASTVLTVKIVDIPLKNTLKVTAKGSIDVMNREGTSITYTPKISNISGKVVEGRLEGMDSDLFENWWDGDKLIVKARYGTTYNTKHTYRVRAVFEVETEDYERLTVSTDATKPLSIKVKQGKPKLTVSTAGNTIYRQLDNAVEIKLNAMLNNREVEIYDVWLINYTEDFELKTTPASWTDEEGNEAIYNPETKSVRLGLKDKYWAQNVTKSGKTWKVKLAVWYQDQAGNEKATQVTCSIVVR